MAKRGKQTMKQKLIALAAALGGALLLGACSPSTASSAAPSSHASSGTQLNNILSQKNAFSYQLVTSSEMLPAQAAVSSLRGLKRAASTNEAASDAEIEKLLGEIDLFVNNENGMTLQSKPSDKAEYEALDEITYVSLTGEKATVSMYYNVKSTEEETETDDDDDDDKDSQHSGSGETEIESVMQGILVIDGKENPFLAKREAETEGGESEEELETRIFTSEDKKSFIRSKRSLSQETEDGENETEYEYSYEILKDGNVTESFSLEREVEDGEEEIEVKLKNGNYFVKMEKEDGKTIFVIRDKANNTTSRYRKTVAEDGTVTYQKIA